MLDQNHTDHLSRSLKRLTAKNYFYINKQKMKMLIEGSRLLQDVQQEFNVAYPFLKIEFFRPHNGTSVQSSAANMLKHSMLISDARRVLKDGVMDIYDSTIVSELEREFREIYGLHVQVFRKSGNVWLETTMSDGWTLERQNYHGREISDHSHSSA
jgi:hypothetical protein